MTCVWDRGPATRTPPSGLRAIQDDELDARVRRRVQTEQHRAGVGVKADARILQVDDDASSPARSVGAGFVLFPYSSRWQARAAVGWLRRRPPRRPRGVQAMFRLKKPHDVDSGVAQHLDRAAAVPVHGGAWTTRPTRLPARGAAVLVANAVDAEANPRLRRVQRAEDRVHDRRPRLGHEVPDSRGCTRFVSRMTKSRRAGSIHSDVPVKPVCRTPAGTRSFPPSIRRTACPRPRARLEPAGIPARRVKSATVSAETRRRPPYEPPSSSICAKRARSGAVSEQPRVRGHAAHGKRRSRRARRRAGDRRATGRSPWAPCASDAPRPDSRGYRSSRADRARGAPRRCRAARRGAFHDRSQRIAPRSL